MPARVTRVQLNDDRARLEISEASGESEVAARLVVAADRVVHHSPYGALLSGLEVILAEWRAVLSAV